MAEWWSYRPSDFLMFSGRTWSRLVQGWNEALWPVQLAFAALALAMLAGAARAPMRHARWITGVLALAWGWVGWAFHWQRFAEVNTAASGYAVASGLQALMLGVAAATTAGGLPGRGWRATGLALAGAAVAYPLATVALRRGWAQAEVAGALPDPTALLTVGLLLALPVRWRALLLAIPVLAVAVGAMTAWLLWAG